MACHDLIPSPPQYYHVSGYYTDGAYSYHFVTPNAVDLFGHWIHYDWYGWLADGSHDGLQPTAWLSTARAVNCDDFDMNNPDRVMHADNCTSTWWMDGRRPSDRCCACGGGTLTEPPPSSPPSTPSAPPPPCHDLTPTNSDAYFLDTDLRGNVIGWNGWLQDSTGEGDGTHDGFLPTGRPVTCADFVPGSANAVMQPNRCSTTWWSDGYRPSDRCCSCGGGSMSPSLPPSPVPPSPAPLAPSPAPLAPLSGRAVGAASADLKSGVGGEFAGPELAAVIAASACCLFVICFRCRRKSHAAMSKAPSVVWVKQPDGSRKLSTHCRQRSRVGDVSSTPGEGGSHLCADADSSRHFEGGGDEGGAQGESSVECDAASGASPSLGKQLSRLASRGVLKSKRSSLSCLDSAAEAAACCNAADGESGWAANDAASAASAASAAQACRTVVSSSSLQSSSSSATVEPPTGLPSSSSLEPTSSSLEPTLDEESPPPPPAPPPPLATAGARAGSVEMQIKRCSLATNRVSVSYPRHQVDESQL